VDLQSIRLPFHSLYCYPIYTCTHTFRSILQQRDSTFQSTHAKQKHIVIIVYDVDLIKVFSGQTCINDGRFFSFSYFLCYPENPAQSLSYKDLRMDESCLYRTRDALVQYCIGQQSSVLKRLYLRRLHQCLLHISFKKK